MQHAIDRLFEALWQDYVAITPSAVEVHELLGKGEDIINDHVAFRTFNLPGIGLETLAAHFLALGYEEKGEYHFEQKKLYAKHYEHADKTNPKVFISELLVEQLSEPAQNIIRQLVAQAPADVALRPDFLYSGRHWQLSTDDYRLLANESEYAGWMAAWGYRANHFTVSVNHLKGYDSLEAVNAALKDAGFTLNTSGGEIKGGKDVCLAQSSTMADSQDVDFSDGSLALPSCFYEFAQRFEMANGELYQGFVAASADKIFESTNAS